MGGGGLILFHHLIFFDKKLFCFTFSLPTTNTDTQVLNFVLNGNILVGTAVMD